MDTPGVSTFLAVLACACWASIAAIGIAVVWSRGAPRSRLGLLCADIRAAAPWLAWFVALGATVGSLYYSEVAHFIPCQLCWYQRIAMYPLAVTLLVGALRDDRKVWWYVGPQAIAGALVALYHVQLQAFPSQHSTFCTTTEPCTIRYVWKFGFVSIPFMAFTAFAFIMTMMVVALLDGSGPGTTAASPR